LGLILGYDRWQETGDLPFHQSVSRPMESISLALLRSKPFAKHWSLQTGMAYARTTRQVSREIIGKTFKPKTTINYFADGSTSIDSIYVAVEYTRHIRHYNVWRQIGIPVSLQYRLAIGQGLLLPQVGFQASLLSAKGIGFIKDGDTDAQIFKNQYQQQILLQAHAGFDWMFDLGEICSVSIGPRFQFDLTPRSSKSVKQKEYFWQCGVQLGVWRNLR
jgi:hypothetical protein